jgi:anti-sigma regulatory factor (Ser/Thr protein kinase)
MDMNLHGSVSLVLPIEESSQVGYARRLAQRLAQTSGFDAEDAGRVALVTTELATNLLRHAGHGELHLRQVPGRDTAGREWSGVEVIAIDRGPGFELQACLADGFSTGSTPGTGLGALLRKADVFDTYLDSRGAALLARLYPAGSRAVDCRFGVSQHALHLMPACGDVWHIAVDGRRISLLLIDGLGHGEDAEASARTGEAIFAAQPFAAPQDLLADMHQAMQGGRGGAVALAQYDGESRLDFVGIGNIGAVLLDATQSRGLASHPGILGGQYRKAQVFSFTLATRQLLVLFSDGLQSRWNLGDYPGLIHRHPALVAAVLHRDHCRGRDDVTVLAIALEAFGDR